MLLATDTFSTEDEGAGLIRLTWADVRDRVLAVNPEFCALIDEISPSKEFAFYLGYYDYGTVMCSDQTVFIPTMHGDYLPLNQSNVRLNKFIMDDLGYGAHSAPLSIIVDKTVEFFVDRKESHVTLPCTMLHAGSFIATRQVFNDAVPTNEMYTVAGCRSAMMLPPISCSRRFANIQRQFSTRLRKPDYLYQHGPLFADLVRHEEAGCQWKMAVVFFPHELVKKIKTDPGCYKIKLYFYEYAVSKYLKASYEASFMSLILTEAQRKQGVKVDPYIADTVHHVYKIAAGFVPGFAPASDETYLPRAFLQRVFVDIYGVDKSYPTILHPSYFNLHDSEAQAVYYSRQYPTTFAASPKTRNNASITHELGEIQYLLDESQAGIATLPTRADHALWLKNALNMEFCTYHSYKSIPKNIVLNGRLPLADARFADAGCALKLKDRFLSDEGAFTRGCVAIRFKKDNNTVKN